jgi:filamentous hemagglutinin
MNGDRPHLENALKTWSVPFLPSRSRPLNKFFVNNAKTNYDQLIKHIEKADIVPLDFRNLTIENQGLVKSWIDSLPSVSKDKIIILR